MNIGTLTKEDGRYTFVVPAARVKGQQVQISARLIGYRQKSATIALAAGAITQDFVLEANPLRLGEVVVTGAGTASTREKLGIVVNSVDSTSITNSNETNIVNALAAKAPNVKVNSSGGRPGRVVVHPDPRYPFAVRHRPAAVRRRRHADRQLDDRHDVVDGRHGGPEPRGRHQSEPTSSRWTS